MSHNQTSLNGAPPGVDGNIPINADDVPEGASSGYTGYVDSHLASSVSITNFSDVTAGDARGLLTYSAPNWSASDLTGALSKGSFDWRYPTASNWNYTGLTSTVGQRTYLGRKTGFGAVITQLPTGSGPVAGYDYSGVPAVSTTWPSALVVDAGTYWVKFQIRPRPAGAPDPLTLQIRNFTTGDYWGPKVRYEDSLLLGPTTLSGVGTASASDQIGIEVMAGTGAMIFDEQYARYNNLQIIKVS